MEPKELVGLYEAYQQVYEPQELTEEVEIATEYFYEMGLNESGIDILIEELGEEEFVNWVYDISEEYTLSEADQTRLQKMASAKGKIVIGPKGSRPQSTTKSAIQKMGGTTKRIGSSQRPGSTISGKRQKAASTAVSQQTSSPLTPQQTRTGIAGRLGAALGNVVKRAKSDIELVRKTGETVGKAVKTGIEGLNTASDSRLARQARVQVKKGLQRQQKAIEKVAPVVGGSLGRAAAQVPAIRDTYKAGQRLGRALNREEYAYILEHLLDEGYANSIENAEKIVMNMSEQWLESIVGELLDEADIMSVHRKPSKTDKGGMVYMKNPNIIRLQNAAGRERQGRQEREKESKNRENAARYDQALRKGINRATNRSEPQDQYAGYGEIEALSPRADGGAHSGRKRLARRASGR
jgi:hypothetical protein